MADILILEGSGDYADPWHPFPGTTRAIAAALSSVGTVTMRPDVEDALTGLAVRGVPDLLVLNIGNAGPESPSPASREALARAADDGMPILGVHSTATAFPAWDEWSALLGGRWVRGHTFHPPASECEIELTEAGRALLTDRSSISTVDERYTDLVLVPESIPLAHHQEQGTWHPLAWDFRRGERHAAYVGLGHDEKSYASPGARALLTATARMLLAG